MSVEAVQTVPSEKTEILYMMASGNVAWPCELIASNADQIVWTEDDFHKFAEIAHGADVMRPKKSSTPPSQIFWTDDDFEKFRCIMRTLLMNGVVAIPE